MLNSTNDYNLSVMSEKYPTCINNYLLSQPEIYDFALNSSMLQFSSV